MHDWGVSKVLHYNLCISFPSAQSLYLSSGSAEFLTVTHDGGNIHFFHLHSINLTIRVAVADLK